MRDVADVDHLFRGAAGVDKLVPAIRQSPLVTYCPPPRLASIEYAYTRFPASEPVGQDSWRLDQHWQGLAGLAMDGDGARLPGIPLAAGWTDSHARSVSCGGLYTLAFSETVAPDGSLPECDALDGFTGNGDSGPFRRYVMTRAADIRGTLFPLRVGNTLAFSYAALLQTGNAPGDCNVEEQQWQVQYRVLSGNDAFRINDQPVPGRVYLVEQLLSHTGSGATRARDLYYSMELGWVVMSVDYVDDIPVMVRAMTRWAS